MPRPPLGRRASSATAAPFTPIPFGPYQLIRRIGAGGMGEVFLAKEETPEGPRALVVKKVLPHLVENTQFVGRFLDEARVVVRLAHPNIARVYAMGEVDRQYYLAMEYVQGKTVSRLSHRLRERGMELSPGLILLLAERLCQGLDYAHDARDEDGNPLELVHRDLSPANVCVSYRGEVKVIDFGAAQSSLKLQQTAPRVVIGNLSYMAPEQAKKRFVDRRADVYSVGVLIWELLTQHFLPQKGDPVERWRRAAYPKWEAPSTLRKGFPASLDEVVLRALSADADARPATAGELGEQFREIRMTFAPDVTEADLGALLSRAFPMEKAAEDSLLASLLGRRRVPVGDSERATDPRQAWTPPKGLPQKLDETVIVPPTSLAFEHRALEAPELLEAGDAGEDVTDPGDPPEFRRRPSSLRGRTSSAVSAVSASDVGFGVSFGEESEDAEDSLVREIEGRDDDSLENPRPPFPEWTARASDPDDAMEEPRTSPFDTSLVLRFGRVAAVVFVAALLFGFALVWMLAA